MVILLQKCFQICSHLHITDALSAGPFFAANAQKNWVLVSENPDAPNAKAFLKKLSEDGWAGNRRVNHSQRETGNGKRPCLPICCYLLENEEGERPCQQPTVNGKQAAGNGRVHPVCRCLLGDVGWGNGRVNSQ